MTDSLSDFSSGDTHLLVLRTHEVKILKTALREHADKMADQLYNEDTDSLEDESWRAELEEEYKDLLAIMKECDSMDRRARDNAAPNSVGGRDGS